MKENKFYISDYDLQGSEKLGIFDNGHRIYFNHENNLGINNYSFVFRVSLMDKGFSHLHKSENDELMYFNYRCNLNNFKKHWTLPKGVRMMGDSDDGKRIDFNCEKLIAKACPDLFEYVKDRILRKVNGTIPAKVDFTGKYPGIGYEFLKFTEESAHSWAGPFEQDGVKGAALKLRTEKEFTLPILNIKQQFKYWQCDHKLRQKLETIAKEKGFVNADYYTSPMTPEQKEELFNTFTIKEQHDMYKSFLKWETDKEHIEGMLPHSIYMCGNDDCSYSKWFSTEEEIAEELKYLRKMQPLDFNRDIIDRDYIFTN